MSEPVTAELRTLDLNKPFHRVLAAMLEKHGDKGDDYDITEGDYENLRQVAAIEDRTPTSVADTQVMMKVARISNLRKKGTTPTNESLADSYLDRAVYAAIACVLLAEEEQA